MVEDATAVNLIKGREDKFKLVGRPRDFEAYEIGSAEPDDRPPLHSVLHDPAEPIRLGATTITPFAVHHPAPCLAYRIENAGPGEPPLVPSSAPLLHESMKPTRTSAPVSFSQSRSAANV